MVQEDGLYLGAMLGLCGSLGCLYVFLVGDFSVMVDLGLGVMSLVCSFVGFVFFTRYLSVGSRVSTSDGDEDIVDLDENQYVIE